MHKHPLRYLPHSLCATATPSCDARIREHEILQPGSSVDYYQEEPGAG